MSDFLTADPRGEFLQLSWRGGDVLRRHPGRVLHELLYCERGGHDCHACRFRVADAVNVRPDVQISCFHSEGLLGASRVMITADHFSDGCGPGGDVREITRGPERSIALW